MNRSALLERFLAFAYVASSPIEFFCPSRLEIFDRLFIAILKTSNDYGERLHGFFNLLVLCLSHRLREEAKHLLAVNVFRKRSARLNHCFSFYSTNLYR